MDIKYRKVKTKRKRIASYICIGLVIVVCNVFTLIDALLNSEFIDTWRAIALLSSFAMESLGLLYCVVQDVKNSFNETPAKYVFENGNNSVPFVDREELLETIILESTKRIANNNYYYTRNIRYGERNGKTSFAKKLCHEFQRIKDGENRALKIENPRIAKKIGTITYINYAHYADSFNSRIKTEFVYIKGKKNIVVVDNSYEDLCLWTDDLADPDIFFIFLNFNANSDDALFFADDKIKELLIRLQKIPAFSPIFIERTEDEIDSLATKLGRISNNNIGTIIDLLTSNEFALLIETDKHFVDFYFALKHGRYEEALLLYQKISQTPVNNKIMKYKVKFESANLIHFLGDYSTAYAELELLLAEMCCDQEFIESSLGESLYTDVVLLQSHIKKHQGHFDIAASILNNIGERHRNIPWLRAHFSIHIFQLNEYVKHSTDWYILLNELGAQMDIFREKRKIKNSDYFFYEAYYPIVLFYQNRFDNKLIPDLIKIENQAIAYYEKEERRYLTNCYFIKAELYRISKDWKNAEEYYSRCYNIYCHNGDKDILYLVAISCKCIQLFEHVELNIPFDWDAAIQECKMHGGYGLHNRLISQMELAYTDQEICEYWLQHYRTTINPIP